MHRLTMLVVGFLAWAAGALLPDRPRTPMIVRFNEHPFAKRRYGKVIAGGDGPLEMLAGMVRSIARGVQRLANLPLRLTGWRAYAFNLGDALPDPMKQKRADLKKLLGELEAAQKTMAEKPPTQAEADAIDAKVEEAAALQTELDQYDARMKSLGGAIDAGRKVAEPVLPNDYQPGAEPRNKLASPARTIDGEPVVGYLSLGDYVVAQGNLAKFIRGGMPRAHVVLADLPESVSVLGAKGTRDRRFVPLTSKALSALSETKALPTLGDNVIEPTRLTELVRVTEHDALRLRDILNISQTSSDSVRYTRLVSYTRGAATVAAGAEKPESAMELDAVTVPVATVAVWMPVQNQELEDLPQLRGIIDGELLYDVDKHIEELVIWGDGTGENFEGICVDTDVLAARSVAGDTLIDRVRRGITDVRRAGYTPTGVAIDPLDWEEIILTKGSDNMYVWVVVTEGGVMRLWALPVVETEACEDFQGNATEERRIIVGDWVRGATLWDRMRSQIMVGWQDDQFVRNQRTILAELRAAFGIKRPGAFRTITTQDAEAS